MFHVVVLKVSSRLFWHCWCLRTPFEVGHPLSWGAPFVVGFGIFISPDELYSAPRTVMVCHCLVCPGWPSPSCTHGRCPCCVLLGIRSLWIGDISPPLPMSLVGDSVMGNKTMHHYITFSVHSLSSWWPCGTVRRSCDRSNLGH